MKYIKIILIVLIIINLIFSSIIFLNVQMIESPEITMNMDILDVNSEEVILGTNIEISNPNIFDLIISDLKVESKTKNDEKIGEILIQGGNIGSNGKKSFQSEDGLSFKNDDFKILKNIVTAKAGIKIFGFIEKTIPLEIYVLTSIEEVFEDIRPPDINIEASFDKLTEDGVNFSTSVEVYNPTGFKFNIDNILLTIKTDEEKEVGRIIVYGDYIDPKDSKTFNSKGTVFYEALDGQKLIMDVEGVAGVRFAGIEKNISFSTDAIFDIPDIKEFIFYDETVDFGLPIQLKLTLRGIQTTVGFNIYNPSDIPLFARNLNCSIYRVDNQKQTLIVKEKMEVCQIAPKQRICVKTQILIPYMKFLFSGSMKLLPDWVLLRIEGDFFIADTRQSIPISINGYVDPHLIRNSEYLEFED